MCILGFGFFFVYSEQNLSTPNKICALWLKYLVFVHLVFVNFFLYSTTAVCVHFHFWQKIKSKTKNYFLLMFHSTTAAVRTQGWDRRTDGQTDGQTDRRNNRAWIPVENYWEIYVYILL